MTTNSLPGGELCLPSLRNLLEPALVALFTIGAAPLCAQAQAIVTQAGLKLPEPAAVPGPAVAQPPRVVGEDATPHDHNRGLPPIPQGSGTLSQPNSPPVRVGAPGPAAPCTLRFFQDSAVKPSGTSTSLVGEPSVAQLQDTVLQTGNWYAARSIDSGETWSFVSPYTTFTAADGGFCCDQRAIYVPSHGITVWLLQYSYSSTTQKAGQRIAIANGRADLQAGSSGSWHSWYFEPQDFGRGLGEWMDFPDIAYSSTFLYVASNIFDAAGNFQDAVVWRMDLAELAAGGALSYRYARSSVNLGGGGSYRLTQNATGTMYFAEHRTTTTTRAYRWSNASTTISWTDITVPDWSSTTGYVALGPNGVNWAGRADGRITGAWFRSAANEYGFMWHCGPRSGRAQCYVRTIRISGASNTLLATEDTWSSTLQFMYPAAAVNGRGEVGCCAAIADGTSLNPTTCYFMVDTACEPFFHGQSVSWFTGNAAPSTANRWGDYFSVQRHPVLVNTFVGTGMTCRGGGANGNSEPHYVWFGREADQPTYPVLSVQSTPVTGIPITLNVSDLSGQRDGSSNFSRTFAPRQGYVVTAPATYSTANGVFVFDRWAWEGSPGSGLILQPIDQRSLEQDISYTDDVAQARYLLRRTLQVRSNNPSSGIPIAVSVQDINGSQNGTTSFDRFYKHGTSLRLTAPAMNGVHPFKQWVLNGVNQSLARVTLDLDMNGTQTATAVYYTHFDGGFSQFCSGCPGTGGQVPVHTATGTPEIGNTITWRVSNARALAGGTFYLGASRSLYNGLPLPINLGFLGMGPSCLLCVSVDVALPFTTNASGAGGIGVALPNDTALLQGRLYTQPAIVDIGAGTRVPVVHGNALETLIGGNR